MNKEEKELIKELERKSNLVATECEIFIERSKLFTILNLIDKLQKENEELKIGITGIEISRDTLVEDIKELKKEIDNLIKENHKHIDYIASMKKKHEDKIRTKIKELEEKCEAIKEIYTGTYALNGNYLEAFSQIVILRELLGGE